MILVRHGQSHFNVIYSQTRQDPGYIDPGLTDDGILQAEAVAEALGARDARRILASPYTRTLHTAEIIAERLGLSVRVEPLVRERAHFACDVGSPRSRLNARWPRFDFADLPERWWPDPSESHEELGARCAAFRAAMIAADDWARVVVVSHWGFIRGLTGREVANAAIVPFSPHDPAPT